MDLRLDDFRILFAYNSGKIKNTAISCHDTREIFGDGRVAGYIGDPRTLFELQNQRVCYDLLREKTPVKESPSIPLILEIYRAPMGGTYDECCYLVNGERPRTFKKQDYATGIHEVGSCPEEVEGDLIGPIGEVNSIGSEAPLKTGTYLRARFENIHPFADGSGRVGRTLSNYWLMINDYPPMIICEEDEEAYYDTLQQYDEQESLDALVRFLEAQTVRTWARVMKLSLNDTPKH